MTPTSAALSPPPVAPADLGVALTASLAEGDLDRAAALLAPLGKSIPGELLPLAAEFHSRRQEWREALRLLNRVVDLTPPVAAAKLFVRNMAALQQHRPELYAAVAPLNDSDSPYSILQTPCALPTLVLRRAAAAPLALSTSPDPRQGLAASLKQLQTTLTSDDAIALHALGDGYLLAHLAANPPKLYMTMRQCVHVIVEDPTHLRATLHLHDYSAPSGPFADPRFRFYLGPDWFDSFCAAFLADPGLPYPKTSVTHSEQGERIRRRLAPLESEFAGRIEEQRDAANAYYNSLDRGHLASLFSDAPPRQPRVLFFTSRFTTVLQYSTRDSADAFAQLGWDARVVIEPTEYHTITPALILREINEFKPDLIFVLDHLRYEYGRLIPAAAPFACWIQDQLGNLMSEKAGRSITPRDFVLTLVGPMYTGRWGYPPRQIVELTKLTRPPILPATWAPDGDDLVYVSNASQDPARCAQQTIDTPGLPETIRGVVVDACEQMLALYSRGESLPTLWHLARLVDRSSQRCGVTLAPADHTRAVHLLNHPLNNALYRQQALRWVVAAAKNLGLKLALHGSGWESLPDFAPFARGPIAYGQPLEELTRRSKINLQIIPSTCLHQRLLDGLVAGGFFLVRSHPADTLLPRLAHFIDRRLDPAVNSVAEALRAVKESDHAEFERMLHEAECYTELGEPIDLVRWMRAWNRGGLVLPGGEPLPHIGEVSFGDGATLESLIRRYIDDPELRREVCGEQRRSVESRFTYATGMRRVVRRIGHLIETEPPGTAT
jgi:hypothetical protein